MVGSPTVARKQVLVQLDDELVAALDRRASKAGISRSELIRTSIARHLRDLEWEEADQVAIEAYRRIPEDPSELAALDRLAVEILGGEDWNEK
jgi:metal-responsive CopG/Arc/MetJ family transcriptional regulator